MSPDNFIIRRRWIYFRLTRIACRLAKLEIRQERLKERYSELRTKL